MKGKQYTGKKLKLTEGKKIRKEKNNYCAKKITERKRLKITELKKCTKRIKKLLNEKKYLKKKI